MNIKIITLMENRAIEGLKAEHGLSMYIELGDKKILFDTGQSSNFIENAVDLGVELGDLDYVLLSHGHYDHTGGVLGLVDRYGIGPQIYMGKEFFLPKYKIEEDKVVTYIGNPFEEADLKNWGVKYRLIESNEYKLTKNAYIFKNFDVTNNYETIDDKFFIESNGESEKDNFDDEIVLGAEREDGLLLVVGCSHIGIVNIVETIEKRTGKKVKAIIGGTHLSDAGTDRIDSTIEFLNKSNIELILPCHCTGEDVEKKIERNYKGEFQKNIGGCIIKDLKWGN